MGPPNMSGLGHRKGTATPPIHVTEPSENCSSQETCTLSLSPGYASYSETLLLPLPTEYDSASYDDLSADETYELQQATPPSTPKEKTSNWRKVKNVVQWTPFIQTYKRHKYPWVQLAGHQGNFKAGEKQGTILKKLCPAEQKALEGLMKDVLKPYVPEYMGLVESGDQQEQYLQLQDLLSDFNTPCVMDIKMGVRTYLEDELAKAREKPKLRKDMYEKMIQIDPNAPSDAEQRAQAVTKPRYMVWRETISSTATLGFRIEGVKKSDGTSSKDFKTTRTQEQVLTSLTAFVTGYNHAPGLYLKRLKEIRTTLESSPFFMSHELIGSSLLFVHNEDSAVVWLIDFAKSIPLPGGVAITHRAPWVEGSHEDGYLLGLDNVIKLMASLEQQQLKKTVVPLQDSNALHNESQQTSQQVKQELNDTQKTNVNQQSSTVEQKDDSIKQDSTSDNSSSLSKSHTSEATTKDPSHTDEATTKDPILNSSSNEISKNETNKSEVFHPPMALKTLSRHYTNSDLTETKDFPLSSTNDNSPTKIAYSSSPNDSHSPTDIRNLVKSSAETNSIS